MKRLPAYIFLFFLTPPLLAQDVTVKAQYPPMVTAGEQFSISWTVNAGGGDFNAPPFTGFYKLMGPQTSYSSSTQIINGKFTQQTTNTYIFYLQALNEGRFVIPPATFRIKNREYRSDSLYIEVAGDQTQNAGQAGRSQNNQVPGDTGSEQLPSSGLFIRLILSRTDLFQGEHMVASLKLYSRVDLGGISEVKFPDFKGFLKEDLETPQLRTLQPETVNGVEYGTGIIQQFLLYPQVTGEITIDPVEITALVQQQAGNPDPFFGNFFSQVTNVPKMIASKPVKITVKPLPGSKPSDFSGIVGKIDLSASISKDTVNVNDAVNFRITVSGSGNLKLAGSPVMKLSPDIEIYEPKITDNVRNSAGGTTGQKIFEYVLIPRHYGSFTVPPVTYTFFNTSSGQYEKLSTREFTFHARKGTDQGGAPAVFSGVSKEDVRYLGKDIRFLKNKPGRLETAGNIFISSRTFLSLYGFALLVFAAVLIFRREQIRRNADISLVRNRRAGRVAGKRLQAASKCLKAGMKDRFHEEILKGLWGYLSDKLNISMSDLTKSKALEALADRSIAEEEISSLSSILDKCEYARFAPSASDTEAAGIYDDAIRFIRSVENTL